MSCTGGRLALRRPLANGEGSVDCACAVSVFPVPSLGALDCSAVFDCALVSAFGEAFEAVCSEGDFGSEVGVDAQPNAQQTREVVMAVRMSVFIRSTVAERVMATLLPIHYGANSDCFTRKRPSQSTRSPSPRGLGITFREAFTGAALWARNEPLFQGSAPRAEPNSPISSPDNLDEGPQPSCRSAGV